MSTGPKMKPAKADGLSPFQQAVRAARELWLGSPAGELQSTGELEISASRNPPKNYGPFILVSMNWKTNCVLRLSPTTTRVSSLR